MSNANKFIIKSGVLKKYIGAGGNVTIPDGVVKIGDDAFANCERVQSVCIPEGVEILGQGAFRECTSMTEVVLPESLQKVDSYCFVRCSSLKRVAFPKKMIEIDKRIFVDCFALEEVVMPETIDSIGKDIIVNCGNLRKLYCDSKLFTKFNQDVKDNVTISWLTDAASYEFDQEKALKKYLARTANRIFGLLPEDNGEAVAKLLDCVKIDLDMLEDWIKKSNDGQHTNILAVLLDYKNKNFTAQTVNDYQEDQTEKALGLKERTLAEWKKIFKFVVDPEGVRITGYKSTEPFVEIPSEIDGTAVTCIGDKAFRGLDHITTVAIPDSIVKIGKTAFAECAALQEISIPDSVTMMDNGTFDLCHNLERVSLPKDLKKIGSSMFACCEKLQEITLPEGIQEISMNAFNGCNSLTEVVLPRGVKKIGNWAFANTLKLKNVVIPETVTKIGDSAFEGCQGLERIVIPAKVKSLGYGTLYGCPNLKEVVICGAQTVLDRLVIDDQYGATIYASAGSPAEQYAKENNIPFVAE